MPNTPCISADDYIERKLDEGIRALEVTLDSDVLAFVGDIIGGVDDFLREVIEQKVKKDRDGKR